MQKVLSDRRGPIAVLTLNNPQQYNALDAVIMAELATALDAAIEDATVRCILLTGAGKGFCSGAQFGGDAFDMGEGIGPFMRATINPIIEKIRLSPIPVVIAVNGPAAGAGVGIALAGDVVIAARSARFVLSFVRLGAVLDGGTSQFLQRSIGAARARALALLGEPLTAEQAEQWGLIWKCVDDERLDSEALAIAKKLADGPPIAMGLIKSEMEFGWSSDLELTLETEASAQTRAFVTGDLREGAAAFVEKRTPRFVGR